MSTAVVQGPEAKCLDSIEIYRPFISSGVSSITTAAVRAATTASALRLPKPLQLSTATAIGYDSAIVIAGGTDDSQTPFADCYLLDLSSPHTSYPASPRQLARSYSPSSSSFTPIGSLSTARMSHAASGWRDRFVIVSGGRAKDGSTSSTCELLDTQATVLEWKPFPPLPTPRFLHAMAEMDSQLFVIGGVSGGGDNAPVAGFEVFDETTHSWKPVAAMSELDSTGESVAIVL